MPTERRQLRGTVLVEDSRTERFFRELLLHLGFERHKLYFIPAPKGKGDAKAWIRAQSQYPSEVRKLRQRRFQQVFLITVMDGDNADPVRRKAELDVCLQDQGMGPRQADERIAIPVPTWSIETWLLALLGESVDEATSQKREFERRYPGKEERSALRDAAIAWDSLRRRVAALRWESGADRISSVPSLADSKIEMRRIGVA